MRRRTVLAAAVSAAATAGCVGLPAGSGDGTTARPGVSDTAFSVADAGCGAVREAASVSVSGQTVSVSGTTTVRDGCRTARLERASVEDGELRVVVASVAREGVDSCVQCLTEVTYEASVTVVGGPPDGAVVVHDSRGERRDVAGVAL
ncbi:hypothetical protein [Halobacterium rubrum]|uniref:hypothetical protein n=1 Tax=Halobacterium TaxID=2239 RepID=UPI001F20FDD6|nr:MULTISPECIES: hypothetical protein [Halobacterium]MDH5020395.1 hypothetical protein [Halobacterium rubrum]